MNMGREPIAHMLLTDELQHEAQRTDTDHADKGGEKHRGEA